MIFRRGIYATEYNNNAYVSGPTAKRAWDMDQQEWIPIELVTDQFVRKAEPGDGPTPKGESYS